jgi:sigma-B regulation protein RsbQ
VLQSENDSIAPVAVGRYVAERIAGSELVVLPVTGHCAHLSAPDLVASSIRGFLR